ncbi:unnamed protein product [Cunninghamella blakesleeana]
MLSIKRTISYVYTKPISKLFYYPKPYHFYTTSSSTFDILNSNNSNSNTSSATTTDKNDNKNSNESTTLVSSFNTADNKNNKNNKNTGIKKNINESTKTETKSILKNPNDTSLNAGTVKVDIKKMKNKKASARARKRKAKAAGKANNPLIQRLQHQSRLNNQAKTFNATRTPRILQSKILDEDKSELDSSWTELISSQYKRVYPDKNIPVATLAHGLERTLFKAGIHPLRDFGSKKLLFSPHLESITQPDQFDYNAIQSYITSSQDQTLVDIAKKNLATFVGSTSSISGVLSHIYYQISNHRPVDISFLSKSFANEPNQYTRGARAPKTIYLKYKSANIYAIDADKAYDEETILSQLGKSMEKFLTLEPNEYERLLKENSSVVTEEEKNAPEAYAYGKFGDMVLRSQLDCYHKNLPRRTFDLKTRATMPVRLDKSHYKDYYKYTLEQNIGKVYSFEREYYDMMRSAFLKYNFQVRIGHMDGIMVTYHNTNKIFGFQYISRQEMDARLFGTTKMGDEAFTNCLAMIQNVFKKAIKQYPRKTLRITFDASNKEMSFMRIYVEPLTEQQEKQLDNNDTNENFHNEPLDEEKITLYELYTQSYLNDKLVEGPVAVNQESIRWDVYYQLEKSPLPQSHVIGMFKKLREYQSTVFLPQSDESPSFLEQFKLEKGHYHRERRLKEKKRNEKKEKQPSTTELKKDGSTNHNNEEKEIIEKK